MNCFKKITVYNIFGVQAHDFETVVSGKKKRVKRNGSAPFQTLKKSTFYGRGNHINDNVTFVGGVLRHYKIEFVV